MRINLGTAVSDLRIMLKVAQFAGGRSTLQLAYVLRILISLGLRDSSRKAVLDVMAHHSDAGFYRAIENLTDAEWQSIMQQIGDSPSPDTIKSTRPRTWSPSRPSIGDLIEPLPQQPEMGFDSPADRQKVYDTVYEGNPLPDDALSDRGQILNDPEVIDRKTQMDLESNPTRLKMLKDLAIKRRHEQLQRKLQMERDELRTSLPSNLPDKVKDQLVDDTFRIAQVNIDQLAASWLSSMAEAGFDLDSYQAVIELAQYFDSPAARAVQGLGEERYVSLWESGAIPEQEVDVDSPRTDIQYGAPARKPEQKPYPKSFGDQVLRKQYKPPQAPTVTVDKPIESTPTKPSDESPLSTYQPDVPDDTIELSDNSEIPTDIPWAKTVPPGKKQSTKADYLGMTKKLAPVNGFTWGQKITTPAKQLGRTVDTRVTIRRPAGMGHDAMGLYVGQAVFVSGMGQVGAVVIGARDAETIVIAAPNDSAGREYKMYTVPRAALEQDKSRLSLPGIESMIADQESSIWSSVHDKFKVRRSSIITMAQAIPTPGNMMQQPEVPTVQPAGGPNQPISTDGKPVQPGDYVQPVNNAGGMNDPNTEGTVQQVNPDGSMIYETGTGEKRVQQPSAQNTEVIPQQ